jgi:hypothetical protein
MANVIEEIKLINVDIGSNMNRLWIGQVLDNGDFKATWGRVRAGVVNGEGLQSKLFPGEGKTKLEEMKREKTKKGYTKVPTVGGPGSGVVAPTQVKNVGNHELQQIAKAQLIKSNNPVLDRLIDRLVAANVHRITSSTQITFNTTTGLFQTPMGVVTPDGILKARNLLVDLNGRVQARDWTSQTMFGLVEQYIRIVPHDVGRKLSVEGLFPDVSSIQKESDILDSLEASYQALQSQPKATPTAGAKPMEQVFKVDMDILTDQRERDRIVNWYEKSKKDMHNYGHVKVREIFIVNIHEMTNNFENKTVPFQEVWHVTSQANCLSIMKSGLKCSPPSTAAIAGKMFGNGIYGAINSSKSLGYTFGRWGQGGTGDAGWLFVCQFAMGKTYTTYNSCNKPAGHDSVWAKAGSGLYNDELIVFRNSQVKVKYLLECK